MIKKLCTGSETQLNLQMLPRAAQMVAWLWVRVFSESEYLNLTVARGGQPTSNEEWTIKEESTNEKRLTENQQGAFSILSNSLKIKRTIKIPPLSYHHNI